MGSYLTHTVSGNIVSFKSADIMPMESLKVYFNPVQEDGLPSPILLKPITGWTELVICHGDENLFIFDSSHQYVDETQDGTIAFDQDTMSVTNGAANAGFIIPAIQTETTVTFSITTNYNLQSATILARAYVYHDNSWIRVVNNYFSNISNNVYSISVPINSTNNALNKPIAFCVRVRDYESEAPNGEIIISNWQLNKVHTEYPVSWQSVAGTVYGGHVDLVNGQLIKTWESALLNDPDKWVAVSGRTDAFYYDQQFDAYLYNNTLRDFMSSYRTTSHGTNNYMQWKNFSNLCPAIKTSDSLQNIKQDASDNKIQIAYMLNTPITYQLTPTQLKTFLDHNNIWSNANGNIEVTYQFQDHLLN